jgi:hypothetical protein
MNKSGLLKNAALTVLLVICSGMSGFTQKQNQIDAGSKSMKIREAFLSPQFDAKPWVYWYWMYSNVTKEGIIADLQGFHDVGIGGVFLMDIGNNQTGKLQNRSEEWYELVRVALTEAKKWGIRVNFASPGWSSSGGPWVTPEMSMKELTWSEARVNSTRNGSIVLKKPYQNLDYYKDIAVFAFPSPASDTWLLKDLNPEIQDTAGNKIPGSAKLFDQDFKTSAPIPGKFDIVFNTDVEVSSVLLRALPWNNFTASILAWNQSEGKFIRLADIKANNSGPFTSQIGVASFPAFKSKRFRIDIKPCTLEEIDLSGGYRLTDWTEKAGWGTRNLSESASTYLTKGFRPLQKDIIPMDGIIDLTGKMDIDGKLSWKAPKGEWTILRIGYTTNGIHIYPPPLGGDGLECDKLSKEGTVFNYNYAIKPILEKMGPELSSIIGSQHIDSYEASGQNWTQDFANEFNTRCGYNIRKYLPAITGRIIGDEATTEKFLWDFRHTIGDLFAENHFGGAARESHNDGLTFSNEPYGGPFDFLKSGAAADYPMDEFWFPATQPKERKLVLPGVNTGRTNNKRIIGAESFTSESPSIRWNEHPYMIKATGDYVFCSGVNRFTFHVSAHQPLIGEHTAPGVTCFGNGLHFDRNNTWWNHGAKEYVEYITRCQSLLQAGQHQADVLYFQGSDAPADIKWLEPELPVGYDFDACSEDVFTKLQVTNNRLELPGGKKYKYLVLPASGRMTTPLLKKVLALAQAGATIIGAPVGNSPGLSDDIKNGVDSRSLLTRKIWGSSPENQGERPIGKGRIIWGKDFPTILSNDNLIPDFSYSSKTGLLINFIHRYTSTDEIYFIANGTQKSGWATCRFRVTGMPPEFYKPYEGIIEPCAEYRTVGNYMEIPVWFDESGSLFVVFHRSGVKVLSDSPSKAPATEVSVIPVPGPWQLSFPKGWGAPEKMEFPELISYTEHPDDGIKFFSGTAEYRNAINIPEKLIGNGNRFWLDLGQVQVIAEVTINGQKIGTFWKPPFKIDVTSAIKSGSNTIQVMVTNLWPNRLIGDERQFPKNDPQRFTYTTLEAWSKQDSLLPSGLIGPVFMRIKN